MWISSLGSVLWHRLVETGNDELPIVAAFSLEELEPAAGEEYTEMVHQT